MKWTAFAPRVVVVVWLCSCRCWHWLTQCGHQCCIMSNCEKLLRTTNFLHHNHATLLSDRNHWVNFLVMGFFQLIPFCRPIVTRLSQCSHLGPTLKIIFECDGVLDWLGLVCPEAMLVFLTAFDRCYLLRRLLDSLAWLIFALCSCGLLIVLAILHEICCNHVCCVGLMTWDFSSIWITEWI